MRGKKARIIRKTLKLDLNKKSVYLVGKEVKKIIYVVDGKGGKKPEEIKMRVLVNQSKYNYRRVKKEMSPEKLSLRKTSGMIRSTGEKDNGK
jgi:hypothetical protein